jgi:hypothetical protein
MGLSYGGDGGNFARLSRAVKKPAGNVASGGLAKGLLGGDGGTAQPLGFASSWFLFLRVGNESLRDPALEPRTKILLPTGFFCDATKEGGKYILSNLCPRLYHSSKSLISLALKQGAVAAIRRIPALHGREPFVFAGQPCCNPL